MNDNKFLPKLSQNLLEILEDDKYCDVAIEVGNNPYIRIFRAHMVILHYRSPYLRRILPTNNDGTLSQIKLPNISPEIFQIILRYIYGGRLSLEEYDTSDIIKILNTSNVLGLYELVNYLQSFLIENKENWMEQNFNLVYQTSFEHGSLLELQNYCTDLMFNEPGKIFGSPDFVSIPEKVLVSLIRNDNLQMSEVQVWEHVLKWCLAHNPDLSSDPSSYSSDDFNALKNTLRPYIPHIRFYNLTSREFLDKVYRFRNALSEELCDSLFQYFLDPDNNRPNDKLGSRGVNKVISTNIDSKIIPDNHTDETILNEETSEKILTILSIKEERIELEKHLEFCEERGQFHNAAKDLRDRGKFEEAAYMFIRSVKDDKNIIESLQCFLHLCRVNVLINTMTDIKSLNILKELLDNASEIVIKVKSQSKKLSKTEQWNLLMMEFHLYISYFNDDFNKVQECIQFFRKHKRIDTEFYAVNIWLKILQQHDIPTKYWHEWLQYLLRLCELTFPFISSHRNVVNIGKIYDDFERIFFVSKVENHEQKRKIYIDNLLINRIHNIRKEDVEDVAEIMGNWHVYDENIIHQAISQFLASYIFELIFKTNQNGRNIPDISSFVCPKFTFCQKPNCRYHHVKPTPSILHQRLTLACLQLTVMEQLSVLYSRRLLSENQSKKVRRLQRLWAENLIRFHIRYQSPQTSCPEITYMVLAKLSKHARNGLINIAHRMWLSYELTNNPGNFAIMLKCMFVFQQLRDKEGIDKFSQEMSKVKELSHPNDLPLGYEYYNGHHQAIPVGRQLSLFFSFLHSNHIIKAIFHIRKFIQYTISNNKLVNVDEPEPLGDLVSFMELKASLVFASGPGYCDFCLPRSYLVNCFDAFTAEPLIPNQHVYKKENYLDEIKNSLNQIKQLLDLLIHNEQYYVTIILRLIRLFILIAQNEYTLAPKVFKIFKYLNNKVSSASIKKYVEKSHMRSIMEILKNDLKETGCDSLIIVHYNWGGISRFTELERSGVTILKYNSIEEFYSSLQKIKSQVATEESTISITTANQLLSQETNHSNHAKMLDAFVVSDNNEEKDDKISEEEIYTLFRHIQDSPQAQEAAKRIQTWFHWIQNREKSHQAHHDPTLDKVYNNVKDFCQVAMKNKEKQAVNKYHILLKGSMVDLVVELIKLQDRMDVTKIKLQKKINDHSTDEERLENCLNLEDDLKYVHNYNVKSALNSLSITRNKVKHEEASIEWLKIELRKAKGIIEEVHEWIKECNKIINS